MNDATNAFAFMHQVERLVDIFQAHGVGDEGIERNFAGFGHFHVAWQFGTAQHATKRQAAPDATGNQLERTGGDFLAGTGHADDHRLAPTFMAALKGCTHQLHVADALEGKVDAAIGHVDDDFLDRAVEVFRVYAVGGAQLFGDFELGRVDVDGDDSRSLGFHRADHRRQTNATQAEDGDGVTRFYLGGVKHRADAGGDAATQQADFFQRGFLGDLGDGDFRQHGVFGERRSPHVVENRLAL